MSGVEASTAQSTAAPAVFRAIQILELLSQNRGAMTVTEIALAIPLAKSSVSNLLSTLESTGMVRRTSAGWLVGYKALEIGQSVLAATDLVTEFKRITLTLPHLSKDTALLAVLDGMDVLYLARHDGAQPVRLASDVGRRLPASVTSLGQSMLASLLPEELERRLALVDLLPRPTERSPKSKDELRRELVKVRERGFAIDDEKNTIGVTCFGVALPGLTEPIAVSTTLLSQRITTELAERLVGDLTVLARQLALFAKS